MADSTLQLLFSADTKDIDVASEKLVNLGSHMPSVGEAIEGLAKSFAGLPAPIALAAAAVAGFGIAAADGAEKTMQQIDALEKLSDQSGVSAQKLQVMQVAMAMSGQSTDNLGSMFNKLNKNVAESADPLSKSAAAFSVLGISQKEIANSSPDEVMQRVAKALNEMAPSANKSALEMQLFGKSGAEADTALKSLTENGERAKQMLIDHGAITDQDIATQKQLNASLEEAKVAFQGMGLAVLREVTPAIQTVVQWFDNVTKVGSPLVQQVKAIWTSTKELGVELWQLIEPFVDLFQVMMKSTEGFVDGVTQGSFFKELISELGQVFTFTVGLIRPFVVVVFDAYSILKTFSQGVIAVANALEDVLDGNLKAAGQEFVKFGEQIKQNNAAFLQFKQSQEDAAEGFEEIVITAKKLIEPLEGGTNAANYLALALERVQAAKVAEAMEKVRIETEGQQKAADAAGKSLNDYKKEQNDAAIGAEALALKLTEGSAAFEKFVAAKQKLAALKNTTADEVAGMTAIAKLQEEINALTSKGTALEKAKADIEAHPEMLQSQKEELLSKAALLDADKQGLEAALAVHNITMQATKDMDQQKAAMTLTANELKLYNQELKLTQEAEKAAFGKTPQQQAQIAAALKKTKQALEDNNTETQSWTSSMAGFNAGAVQALGNAYQEATNLNKLGGTLATTFNTGVTQAFITMAEGGKDAFKQLMVSIAELLAKQALGVILIEAEAAALKALGVDPNVIATIMGTKPVAHAQGAAFSGGATAFADGGVVGGPTFFNMGLMGEAGPEAIMPLQRDSQNRLGVTMSGGGYSGGGDTHNHNTFVINSNQPAVDVAKQAKKATMTASKFTKQTMTQQKRPGGILSHQPTAFARG